MASNPGIFSGTPVFRGTRLPVQTLSDYLADGLASVFFLETFEGVTREQVLGGAASRLGTNRGGTG